MNQSAEEQFLKKQNVTDAANKAGRSHAPVDPDVEAAVQSLPQQTPFLDVVSMISNTISNVDQGTAITRMAELREDYPGASVDELVEILIKRKSRQAGAVGAATSGAALIPGVGTLAALTVGTVADISIAFKLQAELVMEIAAAHQRLLTEEEKQRAILLVTGLSAGASQLVAKTGRKASLEIGERFAQKWVVKVLPVIGIAASAGTDVFSTYIIGRRAHAYFSLGPEEMADWKESLRAITGIDERKIGRWLAGTGVVRAGKSAGKTISAGTGKAAGSLSTVGKSTKRGAGAIAKAGSSITSPVSRKLKQKE
jgi:hypothetical protein